MPESSPRLDERIPEKGFSNPDDALDAFLTWVTDRGLTLYPHQEEAILEIFSGRHVVLDTPTGSGKSLVATAMHFRTFCNLGRAWYTAPIKALVSEKFFELCALFGAEHVGMMTGDGAVNRDAPILCCTAEILSNLAMREGGDAKVTSVVMDEFHYYADRDRGMAWQIPLLTLPDTQFLLMSATLGDTTAIRDDLRERTGREVIEVRGVHRPVPLTYSYSTNPVHEALGDLVRAGRAPVYVVHFTQNAATEQAQALMSVDYCTKDEKKAIAEAMRGVPFHSPFGPTIRRYLLHGIGLHHAGLLPRYRLLVERLAQQGLLKIICGTDTLGVGINVPIRTVLFTQLCKFDGENVDLLTVRDFKQIAGRAGRAGFDTEGFVVAQAPAHIIENLRAEDRAAAKGKKKFVRSKPPDRGYRHWDEEIFRQLVERPPEALRPSFSIDHGTLLSLMQHAEATHGDARRGFDKLLWLIEACHATKAQRAAMMAQSTALLEQLKQVGVAREEDGKLSLDPTLQHDFTLHYSLSLFLLDALASLDPDAPDHALDVVTWVEAILEHPKAILYRQVHRAKGERVRELKEAGVAYDERMDALEDVTWPKPKGDEIYARYNAYAERHPWVGEAPIRPKSIVREMIERYLSFADYVKELGLERMEGVLLRYVSETYKALVQNVPPEHQTPALLEVTATLRAMLAHVDSSLLTEWEQMLKGAESAPLDAAAKVDISSDRRSFQARIRAELHALVRALSREAWEEAAACVRRDEDGPWAPDDLLEALTPFLEEHGAVGFDHRARMAWNTTITQTGPHQWAVRQRLYPPDAGQVDTYRVEGHVEEDDDGGGWVVEGRIDLRADTNPDGPLVEILSVGP